MSILNAIALNVYKAKSLAPCLQSAHVQNHLDQVLLCSGLNSESLWVEIFLDGTLTVGSGDHLTVAYTIHERVDTLFCECRSSCRAIAGDAVRANPSVHVVKSMGIVFFHGIGFRSYQQRFFRGEGGEYDVGVTGVVHLVSGFKELLYLGEKLLCSIILVDFMSIDQRVVA